MIENNIQADEALEQIKNLQEQIKSAEQERDEFKAHYESKIAAAEVICANTVDNLQSQISLLTEELKRFAVDNLPADKKSIALPSGTLKFRKSAPQFFYDDLKQASATDERLIKFVKHNASQFYKVTYTESVDWQHFRSKLKISEDGEVYLEDTGEWIEGLHAQILPDKFEVKTS